MKRAYEPADTAGSMQIDRNMHPSPASRLPGTVGLAIGVASAIFAAGYLTVPSIRERLIIEDGIIEVATAMAFLAAAVLGTFAIVRNRHQRLYWLVPAFGLLGFLDEMSFGARVFGFSLPTIDGMEVDSVHDVFDLAYHYASRLGISRTAMAAFALAAVIALGAWMLRTGRMRKIGPWLRRNRPVALLLPAVGLLLGAVALDLLIFSDFAKFVEEAAEFCAAGLTTVAAALLLAQRGSPHQPDPLAMSTRRGDSA